MQLRALMVLLLGTLAGQSEIRDVLRSAEIDAILAKTSGSTDVLVKPNYIVSLRVQSEPGSWVTHPEADEIWVVRQGAAKLSLGAFTLGTGVRLTGREYDTAAGDVVNVPRDMAYRLVPSARFAYVTVRIYPESRRSHTVAGRPPVNRPMPDVVRDAAIQDTFLKNDRNQPLHTLGAASMNHVIYNGTPGPYEVHLGCDDIYFVRLGSALAKIDGHLVNPKEETPGEIRGTGGFGTRDYRIGAGDILSIPRNTLHYMDPGGVKLGYLLLKVWE